MESVEASESQGTAFTDALGRTIQVIRTDQGLSRADLAKRAGISYSYLSAIENGSKPPSTKILTVIATALGIKTHVLLAATDARMERDQESDPDWERAEDAAEALERKDRRTWERQARDYGYLTQRAATAFREDLQEATVARNPDAAVELRELLYELSDEDVAFILEMARKLARRR